MNPIKTVSVCGLGKLGACIAATLSARGFEVVGVDIDPEKVRKINDGLPPAAWPSTKIRWKNFHPADSARVE